jgi:DNA-binding NarL/FixJ family response regulator
MPQLRVLIADDHPVFRHGIRGLLETTTEFITVGEAETGEQAVRRSAELRPDVVLMDIQMPGIGGIEATRQLLAADPAIRVLMVTMFEDDASVFTAMRAGARGYILKDAEMSDILRALRAVGNGEAIFSPAVATRLIDFFTRPRPPVLAAQFPELTHREREILNLIAAGRSNQDIAATLVLSHSTVRNYVSSIFTKLQVADRAQAIVWARQAGLG